MTSEGGEAAADVLTGAVAARTVEPEAGCTPAGREAADLACLNCGAALTGSYCALCGQSAHIHRSFRSLGNDILHAVFHFEGKFWRTIPELVFHPGRLTRRYIEGERAKFISPMALFLFTMFGMYGVSAFLPDMDWNDPPPYVADSTEEDIALLRRQLDTAETSSSRRAELERQIRRLELISALEQASAAEDWERYEEVRAEYDQHRAETQGDPGEPVPGAGTEDRGANPLTRALQKLENNPDLAFYKMKSNGYKWSWLLVPLSLPFMWALFFLKREFNLYDHAVFVTYSISFMMILLILSTLATMAGAGASAAVLSLILLPPLHLYGHLRGAYQLSRLATIVRLFFLLIAAVIVLSGFVTMLLLIGALE